MAKAGGLSSRLVPAVAALAALLPLFAVVPPGAAAATAVADAPAAAAPGGFTALPPARILDTRIAVGVAGVSPIGPGQTLTLQATGRGGIPATGVAAVALNIAVTQPTVGGYLTVYPAGAPRPLASSLNFGPGETLSNAVVIKVGTGGAVDIFNHAGDSHVVVDVSGWYSTSRVVGTPFTPQPPRRVLDTRTGGTPVGPDSSIHLDLSTGPLGRTAVAVNVTVTEPTTAGFLTMWPSGQPRPYASNLNFAPGQNRGNMAAVGFGAGGIDIYNSSGTSHVVVDIVGYWGGPVGGARFTGITPTRILDTRTGGVPIGPGGARDLAVPGVAGIPAGEASAVVVNVTATQPSAGGYLTLYPSGIDRPVVSNLNFGAGETVGNQAIVAVGEGGMASIFNQAGDTHVVVDLVGWFDQPVVHLAPGDLRDTGDVTPDVVIDPTSTFAYLSNPPLDRVEVLRLATGAFEAPIPVGDSPSGLDLTPAGDRLYVANQGGSSVSVVDVAARTELRRIAIPSGSVRDTPYSVAVLVNGKALMTTTFSGSGFGASMYQIDLGTDAVTYRADFYYGVTTPRTMMRASADRQSAVIVPGDTSPGPVLRYDAAPDTFTRSETDTAGPKSNVSTNGDGTVSVVNPGGLVFDRELRPAGSAMSCGTAGVVLNAAGTTTWALADREVVVCNSGWPMPLGRIFIGDPVTHGGFGGNRLARSPDGSSLVGITDAGVVLVRL